MEEKKVSVEMTQEQLAEFQEMQAKKKAEQEAQQRMKQLDCYNDLVEETVDHVVSEVIVLSILLSKSKKELLEVLHHLLELKRETFDEVRGKKVDDLNSHTYTTDRFKVETGYNMIDHYKDFVDEGIELVKAYLNSLGEESKNAKALSTTVLELLKKNKNTQTLEAGRVVKLRRLASESNSEQFKEGVEIIERAYAPYRSKQFIRVYIKDAVNNAWKPVPLNMTDAFTDLEQLAECLGIDIEDYLHQPDFEHNKNINNQKEEDKG